MFTVRGLLLLSLMSALTSAFKGSNQVTHTELNLLAVVQQNAETAAVNMWGNLR